MRLKHMPRRKKSPLGSFPEELETLNRSLGEN